MARQYFNGTIWEDIPQSNVITIPDSEVAVNGIRVRDNNSGCVSPAQVQNIPINIFNTDTQTVMDCANITAAFSGGGLRFEGVDYPTILGLESAVQAFYNPYILSYNGVTCQFDMTIGVPPDRIEVSNVSIVSSLSAEFTSTEYSLVANKILSNTITANNGAAGNLSGAAVIQLAISYGTYNCVVEYSQGSTLSSGSASQISGDTVLYNSFVNNTSSVATLTAANLNGAGVDIVINKMQIASDVGLQGTIAVEMEIIVQAIDGALVSNTGVANATSTLAIVSRGCWDNTTQDASESVITGGYRYNPFSDIGGIYEVFPAGGSWSVSAIDDGFFDYADSNTKYEFSNSAAYLQNHEVRVTSYTTKGGATVNGPFAAIDLLTSPRSRMRLVLDSAGQNMPYNDYTDLPGSEGIAGAGYVNAISPSSGDLFQSIYRRDDTGGLDDILYNDMMDVVNLEVTTGANAGTTFVIRVGDAFQYRY
jgi:hypothetical protein